MPHLFALLLNVSLQDGILQSLLYSAIGILMAILAYKIVDWITPGNISRKIAEDGNVGLAIVAGALILGICIIIAQVISG